MDFPHRHIMKEHVGAANRELASLCGGRAELLRLAAENREPPYFRVDMTRSCAENGDLWIPECGDVEKNLILTQSGAPAQLRMYYDQIFSVCPDCFVPGGVSTYERGAKIYSALLDGVVENGDAALLSSLARLLRVDLKVAEETAWYAVGVTRRYALPALDLLPRIIGLIEKKQAG